MPKASILVISNYREGKKGNVVVCLVKRFGDLYESAAERSLYPLFFFHKFAEENKKKKMGKPADFNTMENNHSGYI